jgi:hypothetical protein
VPAQHATAVDDPRVQVASQQKVELLQKQRNGQADSEEAERAAIEEEGAHAHAHAPQIAGCWRWEFGAKSAKGSEVFSRADTHTLRQGSASTR